MKTIKQLRNLLNIWLYQIIIFIISTQDIMSRKEILQKDLQAVLAKDIATKNPIFTNEHIVELHALFSLYADPRQRRVDVKDIIMTAKTLGLDAKYDIVFRVLVELAENTGDAINFEEFVKALTARIGNPFSEEGRGANFSLYDLQGRGELTIDELKYINDQFKYGFTEEQLWEVIHAVGGYNAETITFEKFSKYIQKKLTARKISF